MKRHTNDDKTTTQNQKEARFFAMGKTEVSDSRGLDPKVLITTFSELSNSSSSSSSFFFQVLVLVLVLFLN